MEGREANITRTFHPGILAACEARRVHFYSNARCANAHTHTHTHTHARTHTHAHTPVAEAEPISSRLHPLEVDGECGDEEGGLQDVDGHDAQRAEEAERAEGGQTLEREINEGREEKGVIKLRSREAIRGP